MYAVVDIETTGGHAAAHGITEIAIYLYDGGKITDNYSTLVNPLQPIPPFITSLTGISNAMVASAPEFHEVAGKIYSMLKGRVFVAHNVNFDYSFVRYHLGMAGYSLDEKRLCTVRLGRKVVEGLPSYSLGKLCASLGISVTGRHRAAGDAHATTKLLDYLVKRGGEEHITQMLKRNSSEQWLPANLKRNVIRSLPKTPGVYYFHDGKGKVIYVGKAVNIRKRVTSHFTHTDNGNRRQHYLRLVCNITYKECASELHALVLESTEIRRLWPRFNYSQKQPLVKYGLYSFFDNRGFMRLGIERKKKHLPSHYQFNLLHEGQVMLRRMIEEFSLHPELCHISPGSEQQLPEEEPAEYNTRVSRAIDALNERLPTFAITDKGESGQRICLLIEKGCFWGMGYVNEEPASYDLHKLKDVLDPFPDNDFIRNSVYAFAEANPSSKIVFAGI